MLRLLRGFNIGGRAVDFFHNSEYLLAKQRLSSMRIVDRYHILPRAVGVRLLYQGTIAPSLETDEPTEMRRRPSSVSAE